MMWRPVVGGGSAAQRGPGQEGEGGVGPDPRGPGGHGHHPLDHRVAAGAPLVGGSRNGPIPRPFWPAVNHRRQLPFSSMLVGLTPLTTTPPPLPEGQQPHHDGGPGTVCLARVEVRVPGVQGDAEGTGTPQRGRSQAPASPAGARKQEVGERVTPPPNIKPSQLYTWVES